MANPIAPLDTEPSGTEPPDTERRATNPLLIVAGTVLLVSLVTFLLYSAGGHEDGDVAAGGPAAKLAAPVDAGACGFGQPDDSYSVSVTSARSCSARTAGSALTVALITPPSSRGSWSA